MQSNKYIIRPTKGFCFLIFDIEEDCESRNVYYFNLIYIHIYLINLFDLLIVNLFALCWPIYLLFSRKVFAIKY